MIDAGMAVDMTDLDFSGEVEKAVEALKDLQEAGKISDSINLDFDVDTAPIEDLQTYIDQLKNERVNIDAETNPEAAAALDELIAKCEQTYYAKINAETDGSLDTAIAIVEPTHIPLLLGFRCGLRLGEAYGCVWEDIDFEKKTLSVNRQVQWVSSKKIGRGGNRRNDVEYGFWYFSEPKYRSYRNIDLDDDLISILMNEKEKQEISEKYYGELGYFTRYYADEMIIHDGVVPDYYPSPINKIGTDETDYPINFVCRRENGTYISPRTMQHTSSVIHNQLQFEAFDYHSLRHTHTTMLIENGAPPIYVQKRLGHKNLDTTLNIYANHLTEKFKEQGNMVLNNIF